MREWFSGTSRPDLLKQIATTRGDNSSSADDAAAEKGRASKAAIRLNRARRRDTLRRGGPLIVERLGVIEHLCAFDFSVPASI